MVRPRTAPYAGTLLILASLSVGQAANSSAAGVDTDLTPTSASMQVGSLLAVTAVSANDVWAVGYRGSSSLTQKTLAQHWDGQDWTRFPAPHPGSESNVFEAVDAVSSSDVWAAGRYFSPETGEHPLVAHWDGTSWTRVSFPENFEHDIHAVAAVSADDVWVAGTNFRIPFASSKAFVGHWDGNSWTTQRLPNPGRKASAWSIQAASADDVWVAGTYKSAPLTHYLPLTEHWDGSAWSVVPAPAPDPHQNWLSAIAVLPSGRAWTIGYYGGDGGGGLAQGPQFHAVRTLAEEWDGTSWSQRETVNPRQESVFLGVAAVSAHDVWAVGQQDINPVTLIEHWDGDSWAVVDTPTVNNSTLWAVDAVASDDVWAVGRYQVVDSFRTLVLHWDGVRWTQQ